MAQMSIRFVDEAGNVPLYKAAMRGRVPVIEVLIDKGASIDVANKDGKTPLHAAAQKGHVAAIEVLVAEGAAVNAMSLRAQIPLELFTGRYLFSDLKNRVKQLLTPK